MPLSRRILPHGKRSIANFITSSSAIGVSKLVAGANITLSPTVGTGSVTITAGAGGGGGTVDPSTQYNVPYFINTTTLSGTSAMSYNTTDEKLVLTSSVAGKFSLKLKNTNDASVVNGLLISDDADGSRLAIAHSNADNENNIWGYENIPMKFATNNTERMRIAGGGNVGIGTNAPEALLHVEGTDDLPIAIYSGSGDTTYHYKTSSGGDISFQYHVAQGRSADIALISNADAGEKTTIRQKVIDANNSYMLFRTRDAGALTNTMILSGANVGIGTTAPSELLHLKSALESKPVLKIENTNADSTSPFLVFNNNTASPADGDNIGYIRFDGKDSLGGSPTYADIFVQSTNVTNLSEEGAIRFRTSTGGSMADLMILSGSNVGIGTTDPASTLHIKGDATNFRISSADYDLITMGPRGSTGSNLDKAFINLMSGDGSSKVYFDTAADSYINGGDLGIGTSSPAQKLDVRGTAQIISGDEDTLILNTTAGQPAIFWYEAGQIGWEERASTTKWQLYNYGAAQWVLNAVSGSAGVGYVGINTQTPRDPLDIVDDGDIKTGNDLIILDQKASSGSTNNNDTASAILWRGYSSDSSSIKLGRISVANSMDMTNTASTQDSYMTFQTSLDGTMTEYMRINESGNVGIGTTGPAKKLHVVGNTLLDVAGGGTGSTLVGLGGLAVVTTGSTDGMTFENTDDGLTMLYVAPLDKDIQIKCKTDDDDGGTVDVLTLGYLGSEDTPFSYISTEDDSKGGGQLRLGADESYGGEQLVLNPGGNVGIGTNAPGFPLVVSGTQYDMAQIVSSHSAGSCLDLDADATGGANWRLQSSADGAGAGGGKLVFAEDGNIRMTIEGGGDVGIGTTSPAHKLDVVGNTKIRGTADGEVNLYLGQLTSSATTALYEISTFDDGGGLLSLGDHLETKSNRWTLYESHVRGGQGGEVPVSRLASAGSDTSFQLYRATNPTTDATYTTAIKLNVNGDSYFNGGNVGIGTTAPAQLLDVRGNTLLSGALYMGPTITDGSAGDKIYFNGTSHYIHQTSSDLKLYSADDVNITAADDVVSRSNTWGFEDTSAARVMTVDAVNAKVGIGVTSPDAKLEILATTEQLRLTNVDASKYASFTVSSGGDLKINPVGDFAVDQADDITLKAFDDFEMYADDFKWIDRGTSNLIMHLDANNTPPLLRVGSSEDGTVGLTVSGNVGIGTTSPTMNLDVRGDSSGGNVCLISGTSTGSDPIFHVKDSTDSFTALFEGNRAGDQSARIELWHNPATPHEGSHTFLNFKMNDHLGNKTTYGKILSGIDDYTDGTEDGYLAFSQMKNGTITEGMRINSTGVGIGTGSPAHKLDVAGTTQTGDLIVTGSTLAVQKAIKTDIADTDVLSDSYSHYMVPCITADAPASVTITVTAPASPAVGDEYFITSKVGDGGGGFAGETGTVRIVANTGQTINGVSGNINIDTRISTTPKYTTAHLICVDTNTWAMTISDVGPVA